MRGGDDGSGLKERSNGRACGSEGRRSCGSISIVEEGRRYPAVVRRRPRVLAKPLRIKLWAPLGIYWILESKNNAKSLGDCIYSSKRFFPHLGQSKRCLNPV